MLSFFFPEKKLNSWYFESLKSIYTFSFPGQTQNQGSRVISALSAIEIVYCNFIMPFTSLHVSTSSISWNNMVKALQLIESYELYYFLELKMRMKLNQKDAFNVTGPLLWVWCFMQRGGISLKMDNLNMLLIFLPWER